jgi:hypothetical protein
VVFYTQLTGILPAITARQQADILWADMSLPLPEKSLVIYHDTIAPLTVDHRIFEATTSIGKIFFITPR